METAQANELVSLHEINEWNVGLFCFDGVIINGGVERYVQNVPFKTLAIGGYKELDQPTVGDEVWIQSLQGQKAGVWYRLSTPAPEYQRFHEPFLWMADLAKHVVDYLHIHWQVTLNHFRELFRTWVHCQYGNNGQACKWLNCSSKDFRSVVAAHANFLYCQASQVDNKLEDHPIWKEIHPRFLDAVKEQVEQGTTSDMYTLSKRGPKVSSRRKTTVTPYVYDCFKHLTWAKFLYCQKPSVSIDVQSSCPNSGPASPSGLSKNHVDAQINSPDDTASVMIHSGDVVVLPRDKESAWKTSDAHWYGYVHGIKDTSKGPILKLLWLYRPSDTECRRMHYPYAHELFLSDHCNCGDPPIFADEVTHKSRVAFFGTPSTKDVDFFVRQKYIQGDGAWESLKDSDFRCKCHKEELIKYLPGDTLLVRVCEILEPVVFIEQEHGKIRVRRLLRKRDCGHMDAECNELIFSNKFQSIAYADVHRKCHVRIYTQEDKIRGNIPPPYCRRGMADHFYMILEDLEDSELGPEPFTTTSLRLINQGWDPLDTSPRPPMQGLDLYCGGGNFGRGLEEGGAVENQWAVDWCSEAIHTYKANMIDQDAIKLFRGSVNDYLTQAMQGKGRGIVAQLGEVEFISAGSPCPGFSNMNPFKGNDKGLFDASMVASVVSFVDFYKPRYALMENVKGMAGGHDTNNVLAQVICALLGIGYQVRTFGLDAWNFGSPQSRSRVFISIAAPGMEPMPEPPHTHSHPETVRSASLGKTPNGLYSGSRYTSPTPFTYISAAEATKDLPETDGRISCIPYPDHRMSSALSTLQRVCIASIPRFPGGGSFISAYAKGYMPQAQIDDFPWNNPIQSRNDSNSWKRVRGGGLIPTIMTRPRPWDGVSPACLHWDQHRVLTIMEVRRAQGFPDHEVLIGSPSEQWKIIGNSVDRSVALALGLSLRTAWLANAAKETVNARHVNITTRAIDEPLLDQSTKTLRSGIIEGEAAGSIWQSTDTLHSSKSSMITIRATSIATSTSTAGKPFEESISEETASESHHQSSFQSSRGSSYQTCLSGESQPTLQPSRVSVRETTTSKVTIKYYNPS